MLHSAGDAADLLKHGQSFLGPGWREAQSFDDVSDPEDYSDTEEETYVVLDLGSTADTRSLQAESSYQLIGMDTPMPFLKIGNQVYQGQVTPLIGDEVILELKREYDRPAAKPSHPPFAVSAQRLTFRAVKLEPRVSRTDDIDGTPAADNAAPAETPVQYTAEGRIRRVTVDKTNHMATRPIFVQPRGRGGVQPSGSASANASRHGTPGGATPAPEVLATPVAETQSVVVGQGGDTGQTASSEAQPDAQGVAGEIHVQAGDAPRVTVPPDQPALEAEDWFDSAVANIDPSLRSPVEGSRTISVAPEATPQPPTVQTTLESVPAPPVQASQPAPAVSEGSAPTITPPGYIPFISSSSYRPPPPNVAATTVPRKVGRPRKGQIQIFDVAELMDIDVSQLNSKSRIELLPRPTQIDETLPGPSDMPGALGPLQVFTKTQVIKFQAGMPLSGKGSRGRRSSGLGGRGAGTSRSTPLESILGPGEEHGDGSESGPGPGPGPGQAAAGSAASDLPDIPGLPPGLVVDRKIAVRLAKAEKRRQAILEEQNKESLDSREFVTGGVEDVEEALARQAEAEAAAASVSATTTAGPAAGGEDTSTT